VLPFSSPSTWLRGQDPVNPAMLRPYGGGAADDIRGYDQDRARDGSRGIAVAYFMQFG